MSSPTKITPADYPDLLAAADAGVSQRELARRKGCAPSLIARHLRRAQRARERGELAAGRRSPSRFRKPLARFLPDGWYKG